MRIPILSYLQLTKPAIMILILAAGATALFVEGSLVTDSFKFAAFLFGLFLTGGCANALNQYFEREIDARMVRTSKRRPLPLGKLTGRQALIFSVVIGIAGVMILWTAFNQLTALLAVGTILFYSLFYTLWLKPNTRQNIVIGGVAGAMVPVGAWTAATGTTALTPWVLFAIIFLWTPPHFLSLAVRFKNDYRETGLPMMPVVKGDAAALNQAFYYTLILFGASLLLLVVNFGWAYMASSVVLGLMFVKKTFAARKHKEPELIRDMFKFSIFYLFGIFFSLILDTLL